MLPNNFLGHNVQVTNSIQHMGKTIEKGSVVVTFSEFGSQFYFVHLILLNGEDDFLLVVKSLNECYLNEHLRAFKIYNITSFHWEILTKVNMQNAFVTYINKLSDGMCYISKNWM